MFTKAQLETLEDILDGKLIVPGSEALQIPNFETEVPTLNLAELKDLRFAVHHALWTLTRPVPRKDKDLIQAAIADGRIQIYTRPKPAEPASVSRLRPKTITAKDGEELLAALGLGLEG